MVKPYNALRYDARKISTYFCEREAAILNRLAIARLLRRLRSASDKPVLAFPLANFPNADAACEGVIGFILFDFKTVYGSLSRMKVFNAKNQPVSIYGLFLDGLCVYVGQSISPDVRRMAHMKTKQFDEFKVFRTCRPSKAGHIEQQIISAYKKRGECSLNRHSGVMDYSSISNNGYGVFVKNCKMAFKSQAQAARFLGYGSTATFKNEIARGALSVEYT